MLTVLHNHQTFISRYSLPPFLDFFQSADHSGSMTYTLSCNSYAPCLMPHVRPCHVECLSNPNSRNAPASSLLSLCAASTSALLCGPRSGENNHANGGSCSPHRLAERNDPASPYLLLWSNGKEDETSDTVIVIGEKDERRPRARARARTRTRARA